MTVVRVSPKTICNPRTEEKRKRKRKYRRYSINPTQQGWSSKMDWHQVRDLTKLWHQAVKMSYQVRDRAQNYKWMVIFQTMQMQFSLHACGFSIAIYRLIKTNGKRRSAQREALTCLLQHSDSWGTVYMLKWLARILCCFLTRSIKW